MDVDGLVADVIVADGPQADLGGVRRADQAHVGAAGADLRLDGVADQARLAHAALAPDDPDVGGLPGVGVEVVLDVAAGDVQVADLALQHLDAAALAVADVAAADDRLVQVDPVQEDADALAVVDVAGAQEDVAAALGEADAVPHAADQAADQGGLHDADELQAVGLGVAAGDLQPLQQRHALLEPDAGGQGGRVGGLGVRAGEAEGGSGSGHDDAPDAVADEAEAPRFVEPDLDGLAEQEVAARELDDAVGGVGHGVADGLGVVGLAVAFG